MNKLISVIMSTKDTDEEMLKTSIESILKQTYQNFEFIIICDGGQKDYDIVRSYNDNRIKIIKHEEPMGLTKSLNEALKISKGEYIARMDSDDISLDDRFMTQIKFMEKRKDVDICSTMTKNFGNSKKFSINLYNDASGIKSQLFLYNCLAHPAIMMRTKFIKDNNIQYDENFKYSQDYELWSRCSKIGNLCVINKVCLLYRMHSKQISTAKILEQNDLCKYIYMRNLKELQLDKNEDLVEKLFYLSGRTEKYYQLNDELEIIENILMQNLRVKIYNQKKLSQVLYFKLFFIALKKNKKILPLKYILKNNLIWLIGKKMALNLYFHLNWISRKTHI